MIPRPKPTRVLLTVMYADGTSIAMDIKDPAAFELDEVPPHLDDVRLDDSNMLTYHPVEMKLRVRPDRPALVSIYPIPEGRLR